MTETVRVYCYLFVGARMREASVFNRLFQPCESRMRVMSEGEGEDLGTP